MKFSFTPKTGRVIDMLKRWKFADIKTVDFNVDISDSIAGDGHGGLYSVRRIAEILIHGRPDMPARPFLDQYFAFNDEWRTIVQQHMRKRIKRNTNGLPCLELYLEGADGVAMAIEQSIREFIRRDYSAIGAPWSQSYAEKMARRMQGIRREVRWEMSGDPDVAADYRERARDRSVAEMGPSLLHLTGRLANSIQVTVNDEQHWEAKTGSKMPRDDRHQSSDATISDTQATLAE